MKKRNVRQKAKTFLVRKTDGKEGIVEHILEGLENHTKIGKGNVPTVPPLINVVEVRFDNSGKIKDCMEDELELF